MAITLKQFLDSVKDASDETKVKISSFDSVITDLSFHYKHADNASMYYDYNLVFTPIFDTSGWVDKNYCVTLKELRENDMAAFYETTLYLDDEDKLGNTLVSSYKKYKDTIILFY